MASTFKNIGVASVGTAVTNVITVSTGKTTTVIGLSLANLLDTLVTVSVLVGTVYILKNVPVPTGSTLVPIGSEQKLVLVAGDILKVSCSAAGGVSCFMSYLESA